MPGVADAGGWVSMTEPKNTDEQKIANFFIHSPTISLPAVALNMAQSSFPHDPLPIQLFISIKRESNNKVPVWPTCHDIICFC